MEQKEIVYTVIVTYNGMKWINKCLSTLRLSTVSTTIVVVDNGSNDGTCDFILTNFPEVVLMPQNKNLGFGQANNIGMLYAMEQGANHVLLLNQDAYLQPEAIEMMLKVADGKNIVTPVHLCGDGNRIDSMFRLSLRRADNELFDDLLIKGQPEPSYSIGEVCAACWFMPSSLIKEVGGFNPLFFQYGEDNNYYTRMVFHGRGIILASMARVWHDRKVHGNEALFTQKEIFLNVLITACNPNLSIVAKVKKFALLFANRPLLTIKGLLKVLRLYPKIVQSLKQEVQKTDSWL